MRVRRFLAVGDKARFRIIAVKSTYIDFKSMTIIRLLQRAFANLSFWSRATDVEMTSIKAKLATPTHSLPAQTGLTLM
jgi:hypothetical protein